MRPRLAAALVTASIAATLVAAPTAPAAAASGTAEGAIVAGVDAGTGKQQWSRTVGSANVGILTVPYVGNGVTLVTLQSCRSSSRYRSGDISLVALDTTSGRTRWTRKDAAVAFTSSLGLRSPLPIVPLTLANGDLLGVDARTGATKWTRRHAGASDGGSPINVSAHIEGTVGDVLLATRSKVGEPPFLEGYDLRTGERRWRVQDEAFRYDFATTTGEDLLTIPASQGPLVVQARSLRGGAVTAAETYTSGDGISEASSDVRVSGTKVVVGVSQQPLHVVVFDRATRTQAWQADGQLDAIVADRVLVGTPTGDSSLVALDAGSGAVTWTVHHGWGARVIDERRVVVNVGTIGSSRGLSASAVDVTTGAALWTRTQEPAAVPGTTATTTLVSQPGCVPGASTDPKTG